MIKKIITSSIIVFCFQGCHKPVEKNEAKLLANRIDSLMAEISSIKCSNAYLFSKALDLEATNKDSATFLYEKLADSDKTSYWGLAAQERLCDITPQETPNNGLINFFHYNSADTLSLSLANSKCGEWGGDYEIIKIYIKNDRQTAKVSLLADYHLFAYDCNELESNVPPEKQHISYSVIKEIPVLPSDNELILKSISSLSRQRLTDIQFPHPGNYTTVELISDGKKPDLYIRNHALLKWSEFYAIKKRLLSRKQQ